MPDLPIFFNTILDSERSVQSDQPEELVGKKPPTDADWEELFAAVSGRQVLRQDPHRGVRRLARGLAADAPDHAAPILVAITQYPADLPRCVLLGGVVVEVVDSLCPEWQQHHIHPEAFGIADDVVGLVEIVVELHALDVGVQPWVCGVFNGVGGVAITASDLQGAGYQPAPVEHRALD